MHNYKGQLRREVPDHTPTKSSWQRDREAPQQPSKYQPRYDSKYQSKQDEKYDQKYQPKVETKYDKSQISYYQSQSSRVVYDYDRSERPSTRSQAYLQDERYIYNEVMMVRIKSFERQEYEQKLRVQIQTKVDKSYSLLTIFLTDDSNPKFLWTFAIKEGDFMNLKNQQKLKVSYSSFPEMLQTCFRECQSGNEYQQGEGKNNHLLLQIRKGGEGTLFVLQSNRYKESVHLFLHFKLANDQQIKEHLSNKLMTALEEISKSRSAISNLQNTLSQRMHEIQHLTAELNQVKTDGDKRFDQAKLQEKRRMNQVQSKNLNELAKVKRESELELKEMKQKLSSEVDSLSKSKNQFMNKLTDARQKIANLQSNQREQNIKISRLQQDVNKYLKQYQMLKSQNKQLSDKRFQNQKSITELTCKIDSLRSQLQDKKTIITSTVQLKETNNNQISSLQQQNNEQKKQIIKLQTKITQLQTEVSKLNSGKIEQAEKISRQKQKLLQRAEIIKQQQKQVKQLKKVQSALSRQNEDLQFKNSDKQNKIKNQQQLLENLQQKLQDQTKLVMALQKSLNERPGLRTTSNYTTAYQPTMPYSGLNRQIPLPSQLSANSNISSSRIASTANNQISSKDRADKYEPNIRRYEERSKSPLPKRLTQQRDPDEEENANDKPSSFQQPRPIKFKMSQGNREGDR